MQRAAIFGGLALLLLAGLGAWWMLGDSPASTEDAEVEEDLDDWFAPTGSVADAPVRPRADDSPPTSMDERETRRERRREWRQRRREGGEGRVGRKRGERRFTPEQRERWRERFRRRISVRGRDGNELSDDVVSIAQDDVFDLFGEARPLVRDCMRESGAERGLWRRARRESRQMSFDITPEGEVNADTFQIDPPLPEPLASCFAQGFAQGIVQPPGPEGASVSVELPSRRGRRGRRDASVGDAGP